MLFLKPVYYPIVVFNHCLKLIFLRAVCNQLIIGIQCKQGAIAMWYKSTVLSEPQFHAWFCRYKADDMVKCVLPSVRSKAGCKDPTHFFTNSSESLNHLIKQEVEWKESQLPKLINSLKAITNDHYSELEKAVVNRGEWHFTAQYGSLVVSESLWFSQMSDAAKRQHMKKVYSVTSQAVYP